MAGSIKIDSAACFAAWWKSIDGDKLQRVPLLKACEAATAALFEKEYLAKVPDEGMRKKMRAVALESNLAGLEEFHSVEYPRALGVAIDRLDDGRRRGLD